MNYKSGEQVMIGDLVLIEEGKTQGTVSAIVEQSQEMFSWNVDEKGLLIEAAPFGLVFWPNSDPDPVVFLARDKEHTRNF